MADLSQVVLQYVSEKECFDSLDLAKELNEDHQKIVGAIKSLQTHADVLKVEQRQSKHLELTDEGRDVVANGSHEARVYNFIPAEGVAQSKIMQAVPNAKIGFSKAMQAGWITMDKKAEGGPLVQRKASSIEDEVQKNLKLIESMKADEVKDAQKAEYKKRKLIVEVKLTSYYVSKGDKFTLTISAPEVDLTPKMIQSYKYYWKLEEAKKNLLRTHTTAVSSRMLYKLAQQGEFHPVKYFSIDRVFRNEAVDATHLAEFHQIEGVVADYGLTLGDLMGVINEFFKKLGIEKLRFKPAYNPYTEPSMEIFSYHDGLKKWVEIGNSGIFRPEMLLPMGLPKGVSVIAWGLSLERPTMIKYKIDDIRTLIGPKVDLQMVYNNPMCRLDK
ncbi:hypothetical protein KUTeg_017049 [Tegillarca granosa]|uniref:phenylalanine--tRNA ligase n=1 Tax=Tegillarca granosa TaxID=220873 RepID=A0ABQ9EMR8_TEGGR|nr:hypothetical protein KUTeg_017049 [Tegillarca granosa]